VFDQVMRVRGRAGAAIGIALTLSGFIAGQAAAYYRIDHAFVPGIGQIDTVLPSNTKVHPPGRIPDAKPITERQLNKELKREGRLNRRVEPGPDIGPADEIMRIKRQAGRDLFLDKVAVTCKPIPKAALWVVYYVHAPPGRRPEVNSVESSREDGDYPDGCEPARLRIDRWQGVRLDSQDPDRARAMLRGAIELKQNGKWHDTDQRAWKLALRRESDRWRMATVYEQFTDNSGED
jgi:hypothetical protein